MARLAAVSRQTPLPKLIDSVYYAMRALERRLRPQELPSTPIMRGIESEPDPEAQSLAVRWLEEIESMEGRPIDEFDARTLDKYLGELAETVRSRSQEESPADLERGHLLLDRLRAAVPY